MAPGQALRSLRNCFVTALIAYHKRNRDEHNHECAIRRKHPDGEKREGTKDHSKHGCKTGIGHSGLLFGFHFGVAQFPAI